MIDGQTIERLTERLRNTLSMNQAANVLLDELLELAKACFHSSTHGRGVQVLRGMIHLRSAGSYHGLVTRETDAAAQPQSNVQYVPSATVWEALSKRNESLTVDVTLRLVRGTKTAAEAFEDDGSEQLDDWKTAAALLERGTTHILIIPIIRPGGVLAGLVSLEAHCQNAIGEQLAWCNSVFNFELIVSLATSYLVSMPVKGDSPPTDELLPVVGDTTARIIHLLRSFAGQSETILLNGETGVGKSRLAKWCHAQSPRQEGPFEMLDLSTVPQDMQLAELFGWRRGAFTGAVVNHYGAVERAAGGTLFIDEIDKLSLSSQAGLLELLEARKFRILGSQGGLISADVRFIVATNLNLIHAVDEGTFREDLFYRINVLPVTVPALKERADELSAWATYMVNRQAQETGNPPPHIHDSAIGALAAAQWPGNLRQLDNVVRRALAIAFAQSAPGDAIDSIR